MPVASNSADIVALHEQGLPPALIAERLGLSAPSVTRKLRLSGVRLRPPRGDLADRLADAFAAGASLTSAAREVGVPVQRARRCWQRVCERLGEEYIEE